MLRDRAGRGRAVYHGVPGHPVVLGPTQLEGLAGIHGDHGARQLLAGLAQIECSDLATGVDIDTVGDLDRLRAARPEGGVS